MARYSALALSVVLHAAAATALFAGAPPPPADLPELPPPRIAGDTFELPAPAVLPPAAGGRPEPARAADGPAADAASEGVSAAPRPRRPARSEKARRRGAPPAAPAGSAEGTLYGAVGDRSARDLATSFARAFTQTASADPAWRTAPLGPAGRATVTVTLDPSGHITDARVTGSPSRALASSIRRTMALVRARPFVAHGAVTAIHLEARVTEGPADDGLASGRFGISVRGGEASFVLPIGRRIQVRVR